MVVMKIKLYKDSAGALHAEFLDGLNSVSQNNSNVNGVLVVLDNFDLMPEEVLRIAYELESGAEVDDYTLMEDNGDGTYSAEVPPAVTRSDVGTEWFLGLQIASNWVENDEYTGYLHKQNLVSPLPFTVNNAVRDLNGKYPTKGDLTALYKEAQEKIKKEEENTEKKVSKSGDVMTGDLTFLSEEYDPKTAKIGFDGAEFANELEETSARITHNAVLMQKANKIMAYKENGVRKDDRTIFFPEPRYRTPTEENPSADPYDETLATEHYVDKSVEPIKSDISGIRQGIDPLKTKLDKVEEIAKGAQQALSFATYADMQEAFVWGEGSLNAAKHIVGQSVYIGTLNVPDLWISAVAPNGYTNIYDTDEAIVNALKADGYIISGHYQLRRLETGKVPLSNYVNKAGDEMTGPLTIGEKWPDGITFKEYLKLQKDGIEIGHIGEEEYAGVTREKIYTKDVAITGEGITLSVPNVNLYNEDRVLHFPEPRIHWGEESDPYAYYYDERLASEYYVQHYVDEMYSAINTSSGESFPTYQDMVAALLEDAEGKKYKVPTSIYIETVDVPDLWVSKVEEDSNAYTYTDDETIVSALVTNGYIQVGYYRLARLETGKVNLPDYVKFTDYASTDKAGVSKVKSEFGTSMSNGVIYLVPAFDNEITSQSAVNYRPLMPRHISKIVKVGTTNNTETWTDEDKAAACETIGALKAITTTYEANVFRIYSVDNQGNQQIMRTTDNTNVIASQKYVDDNFVGKNEVSSASVADMIVRRTTNGNINVPITPLNEHSAISKGWVEGLIAELASVEGHVTIVQGTKLYKHYIEYDMGGWTVEIQIVSTRGSKYTSKWDIINDANAANIVSGSCVGLALTSVFVDGNSGCFVYVNKNTLAVIGNIPDTIADYTPTAL